ncbi:hypothetical protein LJC56_10105 [Christensenellaceae bacterium OttesenSCG-928-K19]|nr:hypothetical protein [Christensenellaceae bacterium OttesenSCG-928-K19]
MAYKKITTCGFVCEIEIIEIKHPARRRRGEKTNQTPEKKQEQNWRKAQRRLSMLINSSFRRKDLFFTLTYEEDPTPEDAEKHRKRFIRKVQTVFRLRGMGKVKYISVTESEHNEDHKLHHHFIMSKIEMEIINDLWEHGHVIQSQLFGKDFTGLAHYLSKEEREPGKRGWKQSEGLAAAIPEPVIKKATKRDLEMKHIPTPKGYYRVPDSEWSTYHEWTGLHKYAKFIREGETDLATGGKEPQWE